MSSGNLDVWLSLAAIEMPMAIVIVKEANITPNLLRLEDNSFTEYYKYAVCVEIYKVKLERSLEFT